MSMDLAAVFDPLGNAVHTALSFPLVGEDILITGAGPIGLMAAAVARHVGARFVVVTDVNEARLELARKMGADLAVNVATERIESAQHRLGMKEGFDIGLEMSGSPAALPEMLENLTHGARVAMLGLPSRPITIDWAKVVTHMITIKGIYGREMFETWYAMNAMVNTGLDISPILTDSFPADGWADAFAAALASAIAARSSSTGARSRAIYTTVRSELKESLEEIRAAGLYKSERRIDSPQSAHVRSGGAEVLNFCANNYLGLADDPRLVAAVPRRPSTGGASGWPARPVHLRDG